MDGFFTNYDFCTTRNDTIQQACLQMHVSTHCGLCRVSWSLSLGAGCGLDVWRVCCVSDRREASVWATSIRLLWEVLASSISSRRSYSSTTFFLFMLDRCSMPLLLWTTREENSKTRRANWQMRGKFLWDYKQSAVVPEVSNVWEQHQQMGEPDGLLLRGQARPGDAPNQSVSYRVQKPQNLPTTLHIFRSLWQAWTVIC